MIYLDVTSMSNQLLTASEFAKVCQVTPRTIRWYQAQGLLKPVKVDNWNKYAYFAPEQALKVFKIKLLQQFNLPLREIKALLKSDRLLSLNDELEKLDKFIMEKQKELKFLKQFNSIISGNTSSILKQEGFGPFKLFCLKVEGGDYHKLDDYITELRKCAQELKLKTLDVEMTFYLDVDLEYRPKESNFEVALVVTDTPKFELTLPKGFYFRKFPKTKVLTFVFKGPYNYLSLVYKRIDAHIKEQSLPLKGPSFEVYLKNPINTHSPYDYMTKIGYPI